MSVRVVCFVRFRLLIHSSGLLLCFLLLYLFRVIRLCIRSAPFIFKTDGMISSTLSFSFSFGAPRFGGIGARLLELFQWIGVLNFFIVYGFVDQKIVCMHESCEFDL